MALFFQPRVFNIFLRMLGLLVRSQGAVGRVCLIAELTWHPDLLVYVILVLDDVLLLGGFVITHITWIPNALVHNLNVRFQRVNKGCGVMALITGESFCVGIVSVSPVASEFFG